MTKELIGSLELNRIYQRDCIEGMRMLPDKSVDLIVIDPPYNIGKDKRWDKYKASDYLEFMTSVFRECERVLKDDGSFYWFHNDVMQITKLIEAINYKTSFVYKQFLVWNKRFTDARNKGFLDGFIEVEHLRNYQQMAEYCLFYTLQDERCVNAETVIDNFREIIERIQSDITNSGVSKEEIIDMFAEEGRYSSGLSARVHASYKMGWNGGKRFDLMDEKLYEYLSSKINWSFSYSELKTMYQNKRNESSGNRYTYNNLKTHHSVWNYEVAPKLGHVTPKPLDLIENIIMHSSNPGDIILDCFMGSGTTAVASARIGRKFIGFEREPEYIEIANKRLDNEVSE